MSIAEPVCLSSIDLLLMLDYTTLTMQLWQFNRRFSQCCLSYRKISGSFSSTVRDVYILIVVQEVMKFDPVPVIRPSRKAMHIMDVWLAFVKQSRWALMSAKKWKNVDYILPLQSRFRTYKQCPLTRSVMAATKSQSSLPTEIVIHF